VFDVERISLITIREDAKYEGIRVLVPASLGGAVLRLRLDLSFGDPVNPQRIDYPTLLDDAVISLLGYPLENVIAEKLSGVVDKKVGHQAAIFSSVVVVSSSVTLIPSLTFTPSSTR
jgi:hypothetical protein